MYAVIFRAMVGVQDKEYEAAVQRMRELAFTQYGCLEFFAVTEGKQEVAISYWNNMESIQAWKNDIDHLEAQERGKKGWYESYRVEVVEIKRQYEMGGSGHQP